MQHVSSRLGDCHPRIVWLCLVVASLEEVQRQASPAVTAGMSALL
jgi:hypothetical protein